jgi:hypothetical protein
MRLRNWKETVEPTIIDTLEDVHPHTLEEPFHWYAKVRFSQSQEPDVSMSPQHGQFVWVKPADGKWRHGQVVSDEFYRYGPGVRVLIGK